MTEPISYRTWYFGAAAAAAAALGAAPADATIIVSVGGPWDDNPPPGSSLPIDIVQNDGEPEGLLTFRDAKFPATNTKGHVLGLVGTDGSLQLWQIGGTPFVRNGSGIVSSILAFGPTQLNFQSASAYALLGGAIVGNDNYFGFRLTDDEVNGGAPVFGWAQIDIPTSAAIADATIVRFAYEDSGNPIQIGAVPEPSTLGLLALGATGLAALRRRKKSS